MALNDRSSASLKLEISYFAGADARSAGLVIERLANAFAQHTRSEGAQLSLQITSIEIASLHALLEIGGAVSTLVDQRATLGQFVGALAVGLETVMNAGGIPLPASFRSLFSALAVPIIRGQASSAKITVHGDNNTIFYIENMHAERIDQLLARAGGGSGGGIGPIYVEDRAILNEYLGDELMQGSTAALYRASRDDLARNRIPERQDRLVSDEISKAALTPPKRAMATLVQVGNTWYARPEGFNGSLFPVSGVGFLPTDNMAGAVINGALQFSGTIPVLFEVERAWPKAPN